MSSPELSAPEPLDLAPAAVCFHGFLRTGVSMRPMVRFLEGSGYPICYAPTFFYQVRKLPDLAEEMADQLFRWSEQHGGPLDIVTHSYGGLLARSLMGKAPIRRVVMLAPPNQGAQVAELARRWLPVHKLGWDPLEHVLPGAPSELPRGPAEVGIITGGLGDPKGYNPLLEGDNDQTVRVDEARLDGVEHFRVLPIRHTFLMSDQQVQALTLRFLASGHFGD